MSAAGAARALCAGRSAWALACLLQPERVAGAAGAGRDRAANRWVLALGTRHALQAGVTAVRPTRGALVVGAAVDGLHAASALALAALDRTRRGPALRNAGSATGWALLGLLAARRP